MIQVVRAEVAHLPWLRDLYCRLAAEQQAAYPMPYPVQNPAEDADVFVVTVYRGLGAEDTGVFVALADDQVVGFVAGEILTRGVGLPQRFAHAHFLYVLPTHRGQGVARALIAAGTAWMRERAITHCECYALTGDDGWARRGFTAFLTRYVVPVDQLAAGRSAAPAESSPQDTLRPAPRTARKKRKRVNGAAVLPAVSRRRPEVRE